MVNSDIRIRIYAYPIRIHPYQNLSLEGQWALICE
jgi:hypothetical protein